MSIDAIIDNVFQNGDDLVIHLMPREVGGLAGQPKLTIKNFTHAPVPGQQIWGNSGECIIEPGQGVTERKQYKRIMYTTLEESHEKD